MDGSQGPASYPKFMIHFQGQKIEQNTCFLPEVDAEANHYTKLYNFYKSGTLYRGSGVMDQPSLYLEIMQLFDAVINEQ